MHLPDNSEGPFLVEAQRLHQACQCFFWKKLPLPVTVAFRGQHTYLPIAGYWAEMSILSPELLTTPRE